MKRNIITNEAGFGLVSFLALVPLLFAVLGLVGGLALVLKTDAKLKHECRTQLLESQRSISRTLNQILANNKQGALLRAMRFQAEAEVRATASVPPAHVAAQMHLAAVKVQQARYKLSQKALIVQARRQTVITPRLATTAVKARLADETSLIADERFKSAYFPSPFSRTNQPRFELEETPKNDDSPDYEPRSDFTATQEMKVSIEFDLGLILPSWLRALLPQERLKLKTDCNATLEKENEKWIERLSAVR